MSNPKAEVVVIGRARSGKSFLGNTLKDSDEDSDDSENEVDEIFKTSAGDKSCTMDIESELFLDCTTKEIKKMCDIKFDILYTDTPGFPDTQGIKESIEAYNKIVNYINENKPTAIIWLLTPTREQGDRELFKTYALLMKEFANKGIYSAILANNQGNYKMKRKERVDTDKEVRETLSNYGLKGFSDDIPYVSVCSKYLKGTLLQIVAKAMEVSDAKEDVSAIRTFDELVRSYTNGFKDSEALEGYVKSRLSEMMTKEKDIRWHENRIKDLNIAIASTATGSAAGTATGAALSFFTFGISAALAGGIAAGSPSAGSMGIAIAHSENMLSVLREDFYRLKFEVDNIKIELVIEIHKKGMRELATIYKAMGQIEKAKNLMREADKLTEHSV